MSIDLDQLRFVEGADVYKRGVLAAQLVRGAAGITFRYVDGYLAGGGSAVAFTLPLSAEPLVTHGPGALPPFFSGLLPEGRRLTALRHAVKTSADDELSLLLAVGGDVVGDVQVVPLGQTPGESEPRLTVQDWNVVRFSELFAHAGGSSLDRVALPGVQDKVSARMITLPVAQRGDRFILKLDPPEFPHLVANEMFFLAVARSCGLEVADANIVFDADGVPGLLVRRFDRLSSESGGVIPLAQEDGCQVLGRYPADKYRFSSEEVIKALASVCQAAPVATRDLFRQMVFAYLTCNGDAHGKNFSVVHRGQWRVAPAYDIPSSHPYGDTTVALSVAGKTREDIGRAEFMQLAEAVGLPARAAAKVIDALVERTETWLPQLETLPFDAQRIHRLRRAIRYRRKRLTQQKAKPSRPRASK